MVDRRGAEQLEAIDKGQHVDITRAPRVADSAQRSQSRPSAVFLDNHDQATGNRRNDCPLLRAQLKADNPFAELINWLQSNLDRPLDVPSLAARAGLAERSFYRKFTAATGKSPARFIEEARLDAARMLLSQGLPLKVIAAQVGLSPPARLTAAFERRFGIAPKLFREMHAGL